MGDCMKAIDASHDELRGHVADGKSMKSLGAKKPKPADDDPDADDANGEDPEGNEELALAAARRKREADVLRLTAR